MLAMLNAAGKYRENHSIIRMSFFFLNIHTALNALRYANAISVVGMSPIWVGNSIDMRGFSSENPNCNAKIVVTASAIPAWMK